MSSAVIEPTGSGTFAVEIAVGRLLFDMDGVLLVRPRVTSGAGQGGRRGNYKAANFEDGLAPVDVVFDTIGGILRERSAAVLKPNGRMISIAADGEVATDPKVRAACLIAE